MKYCFFITKVGLSMLTCIYVMDKCTKQLKEVKDKELISEYTKTRGESLRTFAIIAIMLCYNSMSKLMC